MDIPTALAALGVPAQYLGLAAAVVGLFSAIATALPPPAANAGKLYTALHSVVNLIALNLGNAKNATPPR